MDGRDSQAMPLAAEGGSRPSALRDGDPGASRRHAGARAHRAAQEGGGSL